jgi:nitric oxide dioxygenase
MNLQAIALVRETFGEVMVDRETAVTLFYGRLFALDPSLRPLFPEELLEQGCQFMDGLQLAINGLSEPEMVMTAVKQWGAQHVHYGVRDEHYHTFGRALLGMLAQLLGNHYTPDVAEAWAEAYYLVVGLMKEAAVQTVKNEK